MAKKNLTCGLLLILNGVAHLHAARILAFFPTPSISHQVTFHPLTHELVRRGHEVTVITTDPFYQKGHGPDNLTEIDVHAISYTQWEHTINVLSKTKHSISQIFFFAKLYTDLFEHQILLPEVQDILRKDKKHFDLLLVEACVKSALILSYIFDAPLVQISSFGALITNLEAIGAPTHPMLYPTAMRRKIHNMSFWEKVKELHTQAWLNLISIASEYYDNKMLKKHFGSNAPTIDELRNNIHMLFLNIHPIWAENMPVPPGVVYTGAIHLKPQKDLPLELKSYLDSSENGVVYVSFGTNVRTSQITPEVIQKFINVLSELHYDVLWKWDQDELSGRSANIRIAKWLPQADLLKHPNIKLFITQGGLQSTDESIAAGVPVIGVPMLGDQWYNVEKYVHLKIGRSIDIENFTEADFRDAIVTVINDESYKQNIVKLRTQMYDQPQTSLERGVWWLEYLLRHGGAIHLRAPAANMSWIEYYELKFVGVILSILFVVVYVFLKIIKFLWRVTAKLLSSVKLKKA